MDNVEYLEPRIPEEVKEVIRQLGLIVDVYTLFLKHWASPPVIYSINKPEVKLSVQMKTSEKQTRS